MIPVGTIAWATMAPGFKPPGPHPVLVVQAFPNGNLGLAFITHSSDLLRVGLPLRRSDCPSAFRERGGPLSDEDGVIALVDDRGCKRIAIATPIDSGCVRIGTIEVTLTRVVHLSDDVWLPLRLRIRTALGF